VVVRDEVHAADELGDLLATHIGDHGGEGQVVAEEERCLLSGPPALSMPPGGCLVAGGRCLRASSGGQRRSRRWSSRPPKRWLRSTPWVKPRELVYEPPAATVFASTEVDDAMSINYSACISDNVLDCKASFLVNVQVQGRAPIASVVGTALVTGRLGRLGWFTQWRLPRWPASGRPRMVRGAGWS